MRGFQGTSGHHWAFNTYILCVLTTVQIIRTGTWIKMFELLCVTAVPMYSLITAFLHLK